MSLLKRPQVHQLMNIYIYNKTIGTTKRKIINFLQNISLQILRSYFRK